MPTKKKAPAKTKRAYKSKKDRAADAAVAKAAGKTVTQFARDQGISRQHASRIANSSEVRQIVTELVDLRLERVDRLFDHFLDGIEAAFGARKNVTLKITTKTKGEGSETTEELVDGGPDHFAVMAACKVYLALLVAGRPTPKAPEAAERRTVTLEELQQILRESAEQRAEQEDLGTL